MRQTHCGGRDERSSALWGTGNRGGEHRSSALWGSNGRGGDHRSRRGVTTLVVLALALAMPLAATAKGKDSKGSKDSHGAAYIAPGVYQAVNGDPGGKIRVIIQAPDGLEGAKKANEGLGALKQELGLIGAVAAEIPAARVRALEKIDGLVVTLDAAVKATNYTSTQLWPHENGSDRLWGTALSPAPKAPTIAIVDSGIDKNRADFDLGARVVARQVFTSLPQNPLTLDGRGHGTFVAGIAAGSAPGLAGVAPNANLIDLDVIDDNGMALTSDVIKAAEWIYNNKGKYNIRVANFSLHSSSVASIRWHPLNKAVEKLWFSGVVVVAAAGNYGTPDGPSGVVHAPGNDPFVLTVGAFDIGGTARIGDDAVASWSAYGYTNEGFLKPEVVAAGRYLVGPVPAGATLRTDRPANVLSATTMQLSGTSFAAPIVAGAAAQLLARNPGWTPDQVKGALMKTARRVPGSPMMAQGRGQVNVVKSSGEKSPPIANAALNPFVVSASGSGMVFDAAAWGSAAWNNAAWSSAAWSDAAWSDAAWSDAAWSSAAWSSAAWSSAAWSDAAWSDSVTYEDATEGEGTSSDVALTPANILELKADPDLSP
jgi:serine protease AprX